MTELMLRSDGAVTWPLTCLVDWASVSSSSSRNDVGVAADVEMWETVEDPVI